LNAAARATDNRRMAWRDYFPVAALMAAALFFIADLGADLRFGGESTAHLIVEGCVFLLAIAALAHEIRRVLRLQRTLSRERERLRRLSGELYAVIRQAFDGWGLSTSEADVAILLLKGLSMREIAELRGVQEKTVRSQAASVYAKSGHAGRHELAAHFIGDLIASGD